MKRIIALIAALLITITAAAAEPLATKDPALFADRFATNPRPVREIGDPCVLPTENGYYLFATGGHNGSDDINVWFSSDLSTFTTQKALENVSWAIYDYWAPEVYPWNDGYVMFFSARRAEDMSLRVGVAFSDKPEGPYTDPLGAPLFDFGYAAIDASLFVDGDGTPYLLYARDCSENIVGSYNESHIYGIQLSSDLLSTVGEPTLLTTPDKHWEQLSGEYRWNEGPFILKNDDKYHLYYSANFYASVEYAVGVATADHPLGPYRKFPDNPILQYKGRNGQILASGTGHNSFFTVGDELFTAYHSHEFPENPSDFRQLCIDRAGFHYDGTAYISGPTLAPQLRPLKDLNLTNHLQSAKVENDPMGLLTDGDICMSNTSYPYTWRKTAAQFSWTEPVRADMLLIYPGQGTAAKGTITLNGNLTAEFSAEADESLGTPIVIAFDEISVESLTIETQNDTRIGEILLIGQ